MYSLTPTAVRLIDFYDDGEHARHFTFRLLNTASQTTKAQDNWMKAKTGQFFMLCLPSVGEAPFTFTQLPDQHGNFRALVRKIGSVTSALFELEAGQILGAKGPYGKGWPMDKVCNKRVLVVGGGCGLAPLVGVVNQLIEQQNYTQLMVVYGARNRQLKMLTPERRYWQQVIPVFNMIEDGNTEPGENESGGTPVDILPTVLGQFAQGPDVVLLAGPQAMMFAVAKYLVASGVSEQAIYLSIERRMHCGVRTCGHCYLKDKYVCSDGPTFRWDDLKQYIPAGP
ncbi:FAD-binding oxidoreductase [Photobacterium halotolerans]|uniref:iron-sulfur cluster-binding protein n=1 Tax=Photobacterium halotolerans TaxID=265726 RepID=UPI00041D5C28|nr:FAD-binding oxidoreductase [Photobacterium halotolerans]